MKKQLTFGELITKLEKITHYEEDFNPKVSFDFGSAFPTTLESSRGDYWDVALGYSLGGYDRLPGHDSDGPNLLDLITYLKSMIGVPLVGWKGGEYPISEEKPVWVDNPGNWNSTAIVDVKNYGYHVKIITRYREQ